MQKIVNLPELILNWEQVQSYSFTRNTLSLVAYPHNLHECLDVINYAVKNNYTICPRGQGYSYGDMILNDRQIILNTSGMNKIFNWDSTTGVLICEPGVRLADVFDLTLPDQWYLPSCPGGMNVTIAGAVANNIHGKDSFKNGNFGNWVTELHLLKADGGVIKVSRKENVDVFKAIVGGAGLLGIVVQITLQLMKVPSAFVYEEVVPVGNIEESIKIMQESRRDNDFLIAWVDAFGKKRKLGRGYVVKGRWINESKPVDQKRLKRSLTQSTKIFNLFPSKVTWKMVRPLFTPAGIRQLNKGMFYKQKFSGQTNTSKLFTEFNFMHNQIPDLNYVYYPHGFLEFQPLIPFHQDSDIAKIKEVFELCHHYQSQSLLCAVKPHSNDDFLISYAGQGYTIGIDIQVKGRRKEQIRQFANALFELTCKAGGKIYLAKDEMLTPEYFQQMYPQWKNFLTIKQRLDPQALFASDMYRRLFG